MQAVASPEGNSMSVTELVRDADLDEVFDDELEAPATQCARRRIA
jgi:hypothetical protein